MPLPSALLEFARMMRKEQTDAEQLLWRLLRNRNFCGLKFRRQYPIGGYILDFFCDELNLAIELDGGGHADTDQAAYDEERTKVLAGIGVRVLRFWNHDLLNRTESVLEEIYRQSMIGK
jgi:very-short-patch-repair endonuclease